MHIGQFTARRIFVLGHEVSIFIDRADKHLLIDEQFLAECDSKLVTRGDGIVTFHANNGDVSYGLSHRDDARMCWLGTRSGDWPPLGVVELYYPD